MINSRISVCMATYNGERHVMRQLQSILNQLDTTDEVIISDDNSTDNTVEIIKALGDSRIKVLQNTNRKGPVGNFENSINHSTGHFILLADQDDIWLPDKVNTMRLLLTKYDLVVADCEVVDEKGKIIHTSFFQYRKSKAGLIHNFIKNSYIGCCMAFRTELKLLILPFPSTIYMHDWWIGLLTEIFGKTYLHPVPLIKYVRHGNNASPTGEGSLSLKTKFVNRFTLLYNVIGRSVKYIIFKWSL